MIDVVLEYIHTPFGGLLFGLGVCSAALAITWGLRKPTHVKKVPVRGRLG